MTPLRRIACGLAVTLLCAAAAAQTGNYPTRQIRAGVHTPEFALASRTGVAGTLGPPLRSLGY